jgi:hypothetical protein
MGQSKVVINFGMQIWRFLYYIHLEVQIHFHAIQKLYFIESQVLCTGHFTIAMGMLLLGIENRSKIGHIG